MSMVINHQPDFLRVGPLRTYAFDYGTQRGSNVSLPTNHATDVSRMNVEDVPVIPISL